MGGDQKCGELGGLVQENYGQKGWAVQEVWGEAWKEEKEDFWGGEK